MLPPLLLAARFYLVNASRFTASPTVTKGAGSALACVIAWSGLAGISAISATAQTASPRPSTNGTEELEANSICLLRDSEGNVQDLSRLCRAGQSNAVLRRPFQLPELEPAQPFDPSSEPGGSGSSPLADSLPDYGVIFLSPVSEDPIHLGYRSSYLASYVGNASSEPLENVRVYYDILLSSGEEYAQIGRGSELINVAMEPGQRRFFSIIPSDVMTQVPPAYRHSKDISIQVKAIGWIGPDGETSSFDAKSYKLARGMGQCHFPWERDGRGLACGSRAASERLY